MRTQSNIYSALLRHGDDDSYPVAIRTAEQWFLMIEDMSLLTNDPDELAALRLLFHRVDVAIAELLERDACQRIAANS